jgi:hypothetical protein
VQTLSWIPFLLAIACGDKAAESPAIGLVDTGGSGGSGDCETVVTATEPENGAIDHYYRDPIRFILSEPDATAVMVTDVQGTTTREADDRTIVFTPDAPLDPSADYTVGLSYCYGDPQISFATSALGQSLDAGVELEGRVFSLDLTSGQYTVGERVGDLLNVVFTKRLLFSLENVSGDSLEVLAAVAEANSNTSPQDLCARTVRVEGVDISEAPFFSKEILDFSFGSHDGELRFARFAVSGTVTHDGGGIGGLAFEASLSVDEMSQAIPSLGTVEDLCEYAANLGVPCNACPDGGWSPCITVAAEHVEGSLVDFEIVEVDESGTSGDCG